MKLFTVLFCSVMLIEISGNVTEWRNCAVPVTFMQIHFSQNSVTMQSLFSHISVTFQLPEWHSFLLYRSSRSDHRCRSSDPIKRRISSDDPRLALKHDLALLHRVNCYSETKKLLHVNIPFHQQVKDYTCSIHLVDESRYTLI